MTRSSGFVAKDVPRVHNIDPADLKRDHFDRGVPCVLSGFHRDIELAQWIERLSTSDERVLCVVARSRNISRISDAERPPVSRASELPQVNEFVAELTLAEAWARIRTPELHQPLLVKGETIYLIEAELPASLAFPRSRLGVSGSGNSISEHSGPGDCAADEPLRTLVLADPRAPQTILSMPGTINRNHTHVHEVLLHQILGHKRVRLFSPADTVFLYMNDERRSTVPDFDHPDLDQFPLIANATAWETVLEPGDVLFLPSYWWHEIRVDEPSVSLGFPVQAGTWSRSMFRLHHEMADQLERCASEPVFDSAIARGAMAIVATATAGGLHEAPLADVVAALRYDYE